MKAKKLLVAMMLGISVLGVTGCGQQEQEQAPVQQEQVHYISKSKFMSDAITDKIKTNDIIHLSEYDSYGEDYQNYEDGVFTFHEIKKDAKTGVLYTINIVLTCNHDNCVKDEMKRIKNKYGKLEYKTFTKLNFKVNDIKYENGSGKWETITIFGEI